VLASDWNCDRRMKNDAGCNEWGKNILIMMMRMILLDREYPQASLIISNFNGKNFLRECLSSLFRQDYPGSYEVIVVDAGSTDGSPKMVEEEFPEVKLIRASRIGIGKALNSGLRLAQGEILAFDINNDERFSTSWLRILVDALLRLPNAGVVGGLRILHGTKDVVDEAGIVFNKLGIPSSYTRLKLSDIPEKPRKVDYVGTPLFHKRILNLVGVCDEDYVLYSEDEDFCARVKKAGYDVLLVPQAIAYHRRSATIGKASSLSAYYQRRNHIRFIIKNFPVSRMFLALFWYVFLLTAIEALMFVPIFKRLFSLQGSRLVFLSQKHTKENFRATIEAIRWNIQNFRSTISLRYQIFRQSKSKRALWTMSLE